MSLALSIRSILVRWQQPPLLFFVVVCFLLCSPQANIFAQKFYFGGNPYLSIYRYNLTYNNYPEIFSKRSGISNFFPGNQGFHVGYQFRKKNFLEAFYSIQYYPFFADDKLFESLEGYIEGLKSLNFGLRYKHTLFSYPLTILGRKRPPLQFYGFGGLSIQYNSPKNLGTTTIAYEWFDPTTGAAVSKITGEYFRTDKNKYYLHVGLEAELPLYKSLKLTASYAYFFSLDPENYTTNRYVGKVEGVPVKGERYSNGGGQNFSLGVRWYFPGSTETEKTSGTSFYAAAEYLLFQNQNVPQTTTTFQSNANSSFALLFGKQKNEHGIETGIIPLPSILQYNTQGVTGSLVDASSTERRIYIPARYKRVLPLFFKSKSQNVEFMPSVGLGVHVPLNFDYFGSFLPNGGLASDYQRVHNFVLGTEGGGELVLNAEKVAFSIQVLYLFGFSPTRELQILDSNATPTGRFISSTPTGLLKGFSIRYKFNER